MTLPDPETEASLERHTRDYFQGHRVTEAPLPDGPIHERLPGFRVLAVEPGPRLPLYTYVSVGAYRVTEGEHAQEFLFVAGDDDPVHPAIVTIAAYYHAGPPEQRLGLGHTVPIGRPWVAGSGCEYLLVSRPYPFGPKLERCEVPGGHVQFLWLLPITEAEKELGRRESVEALESRFDEAAIEYWDPARPSVVQGGGRSTS